MTAVCKYFVLTSSSALLILILISFCQDAVEAKRNSTDRRIYCTVRQRLRIYRRKTSVFGRYRISGTTITRTVNQRCRANQDDCCGTRGCCIKSDKNRQWVVLWIILGVSGVVGLGVGIGVYIYKRKQAQRAAARRNHIIVCPPPAPVPAGFPLGPPPQQFFPPPPAYPGPPETPPAGYYSPQPSPVDAPGPQGYPIQNPAAYPGYPPPPPGKTEYPPPPPGQMGYPPPGPSAPGFAGPP